MQSTSTLDDGRFQALHATTQAAAQKATQPAAREAPEETPHAARQARWTYGALSLGASAFLYAHLFRFPFTPILHDGDGPVFLEHAERMMHGEILYRDIFQFNLPGIEWLYLIMFRCLGIHLWIPNLMLLCAGTAVTLTLYALARKVLRGPAALLPAVAFLVICQRSSLDGAHHWYSTLLVMLSVNVLARTQRLTGVAAAGALLGLATVFTSSRGLFVVVGVAVYLLWTHGSVRAAARPIAALLAPFFAVVAATLIYLLSHVGSKILYESLVVFPLRYYGKGDANSFSVFFFNEGQSLVPLSMESFLKGALWCAINLAAPALLIWFAVILVRRMKRSQWTAQQARRFALLATVGAFALAAVAGAPSAPRMNCAAAFAYILGAVLLEEVGRHGLVRALLWITCLTAAAELGWALARPAHFLQGSRGNLAVYRRSEYDYLAWLQAHAKPGDGFFGDPAVNWVLGMKNPAGIDWVEADAYTRPGQVSDLIAVLGRQHTRFIQQIEGTRDGSTEEDNLAPLRNYVRQHYYVAQQFGDDLAVLEYNAAHDAHTDGSAERANADLMFADGF